MQVGITRLRDDLAMYVRRAEMLSSSIIIKRNGHKVAAIVSIADYEYLQAANKTKKDEESNESSLQSIRPDDQSSRLLRKTI